MPSRKMTVKVSEEEYELIQRARAELRRKGLDDAGITEEEVKEFDWGSLAMGAIVGIGAYLLWKSLTEKE
ncbi:MAG: hypothetical protein WBD03_01010 [Thermoplasmata archaeon]